MNKKSLLFGIILFSSFAVAMDEGEKQCAKQTDEVPRVDLTQLNILDLSQLNKSLKESPVRSSSMPSPHLPSSPAHSPRPIERFLSQHSLANHTEKGAEGLNRAFQKLRECDARLLELQGTTDHHQKEIREITNGIRKLADRVLELERSHDDQKNVITAASTALRDVMKLLQLATPAIKRVPSQQLRQSPNRGVTFATSVAAPGVSTSSSVATSSATAEDGKGQVDDQKSCSSDNDDDEQESDND